MIEIPDGKWCGVCPMSQYHIDDCIYYCNYPDYQPKLEDDGACNVGWAADVEDWRALRCPACLSAYPRGATFKIEAQP